MEHTPDTMPKVLTIDEFCARAGISRATFYRLGDQQPKTVYIGSRRVVLPDTAAAWLRAREK